jgi:two-component system invasion response regulator UvrY
MIRVLIADDHPLLREGVKRVLERAPDITVAGEVDTAEGVVEAARTAQADVILLDLSMPGPSHLEVLAALKESLPRTRALIISGHDEEEHAIPALRAGAAGYLMKSFAPGELLEAIRRVYAGRRYVSSSLGEQLAAGLDREGALAPHLRLSSRELEVLTMLTSGMSLKEIAAKLDINPKTVTSYRARILEKLGVRTNADLVKYALEHDLATR